MIQVQWYRWSDTGAVIQVQWCRIQTASGGFHLHPSTYYLIVIAWSQCCSSSYLYIFFSTALQCYSPKPVFRGVFFLHYSLSAFCHNVRADKEVLLGDSSFSYIICFTCFSIDTLLRWCSKTQTTSGVHKTEMYVPRLKCWKTWFQTQIWIIFSLVATPLRRCRTTQTTSGATCSCRLSWTTAVAPFSPLPSSPSLTCASCASVSRAGVAWERKTVSRLTRFVSPLGSQCFPALVYRHFPLLMLSFGVSLLVVILSPWRF